MYPPPSTEGPYNLVNVSVTVCSEAGAVTSLAVYGCGSGVGSRVLGMCGVIGCARRAGSRGVCGAW